MNGDCRICLVTQTKYTNAGFLGILQMEHLSVFEWLTLSNIGNVASILGIGLSIYLIYNVREIRKSYLFAARAPDLLKRLRSHSSKIKDLLQAFDVSKHEIEAEFARCSPILESLKRKVGRQERKSISAVVQIIAAKKSLFAVPKDAVWDMYTELLRVEEELSNLQKDKQWER